MTRRSILGAVQAVASGQVLLTTDTGPICGSDIVARLNNAGIKTLALAAAAACGQERGHAAQHQAWAVLPF